MAYENNKSICLFVGWLNVILSFSLPIGQFLLYLFRYNYDLTLVIHDEYFQISMTYLTCGFVPWLIASVLLVKGIEQNRHKLMAPWIYLSYVLIIVTAPVMVYLYLGISEIGVSWLVGVYCCLPFVVELVMLFLCLIPVLKLYKKLSIPPQVVPTSAACKRNNQRNITVICQFLTTSHKE